MRNGLVLGVMSMTIAGVCFGLTPEEEAKAKDVAREYVKDHLKAPATAIFSKETLCAPLGKPDADEANGGPTPECKPQAADRVADGTSSVIYRASVDAQNSYGALLRTRYQVMVYFAKGKWSVIDSQEVITTLREGCKSINQSARLLRNARPRDCEAEYPGMK